MHALISHPLDSIDTAVVGCVDVLERTGDSLTAAWRMPLSVGQSKEAAFHLELSPDPRAGGRRAIGSPSATSLSSIAAQPLMVPEHALSDWAWREVAGGMHGVHLVGGLEACTQPSPSP